MRKSQVVDLLARRLGLRVTRLTSLAQRLSGGNPVTHVTTVTRDGKAAKYSVTESLGAEAARNRNWATENPPQPKQPRTQTEAERIKAEAVRKLVGDLVPEPKEETIEPIRPCARHRLIQKGLALHEQ